MLRQYRVRDYDFKLILLVAALTVIGILAIGSAKESLQSRQIAGAVFGAFLMLVISLFDYTVILKFYWILYLLNVVLLALVKAVGVEAGGAQRWLELFGIQFQPSETAKILIILFFAQFIMRHKNEMHSIRVIGMCVLLFLPQILLIYIQPDMSTSIMVILLFCVILFVGGISWKYIVLVLSIAIPAFVIVLTLILQPDQQIIKDYQQTRILAWIYPDEYANAEAYQQNNSIMAIGSGLLWGKGLNNTDPTSVKNGNFILEPQNDFIFAVAGEELGFVGSAVIIILLLFITIECIFIARKAKDIAGKLICCGMAALIGFQSFINISVASGLMPNTGLPLPFVSYGLTSLMSLYIGIGLVLNVGLQPKKY